MDGRRSFAQTTLNLPPLSSSSQRGDSSSVASSVTSGFAAVERAKTFAAGDGIRGNLGGRAEEANHYRSDDARYADHVMHGTLFYCDVFILSSAASLPLQHWNCRSKDCQKSSIHLTGQSCSVL